MNILDQEPVRIRDCTCPGTPHADTGDLVRLRAKLPAAGGAALFYIELAYADDPIRQRRLTMKELLLAGIGWWNLVGEKGKPIPINEETIAEQIDWFGGGLQVFMTLQQRYFGEKEAEPSLNGKEPHDAPLVMNGSSSSGRTGRSTSATPRSSTPHPRPSKSSSPASTASTI